MHFFTVDAFNHSFGFDLSLWESQYEMSLRTPPLACNQKKTCRKDRPSDGGFHINALKHQMQWFDNSESKLF